METNFLPVFLFSAVAAATAAGLFLLGLVLGPKRSTPVKEMPYESGMDPVHDTRRRFDVRFHLLAVAFLVFDVELLFLYPWAVASRAAPANPATSAEAIGVNGAIAVGWIESRDLVFGGVMFFLALLVAGFVYDWRKGLFRWQ